MLYKIYCKAAAKPYGSVVSAIIQLFTHSFNCGNDKSIKNGFNDGNNQTIHIKLDDAEIKHLIDMRCSGIKAEKAKSEDWQHVTGGLR